MTNELVILTNVVSHDITGLDVVKSVNEFYSSAFTHLIAVIGSIVAIGGILIPYYFQRREARLHLAQLRDDLGKAVGNAKKDIAEQMLNLLKAEKDELKEMVAQTKKDLEKQNARAMGMTLHNQANRSLEAGEQQDAAAEAIGAANWYCKGDDHTNLLRICTYLSETILPIIEAKDFEESDLQKKLEKFEDHLMDMNTNGFLQDTINSLRSERKAALKRIKSK